VSPSSRPWYVGTALLVVHGKAAENLKFLSYSSLRHLLLPTLLTTHRQQPQCPGLVSRHQLAKNFNF
jgi:hypothetical protein